MHKLGKKLEVAGGWDVADPFDRLSHVGEEGAWGPEHPLPKETNWHIDEHMGGLM